MMSPRSVEYGSTDGHLERRIACFKQGQVDGAAGLKKLGQVGVQALMKDVPLPLVQRWMGYADLETTTIYPQVIGNEEKSFAGRMWEDV